MSNKSQLKRKNILFCVLFSFACLSCAPWSTLGSDINYVENMTSQELRHHLQKNDDIIKQNFAKKAISPKLSLAVYNIVRIYSGIMQSPSFTSSQINIFPRSIASFFNPMNKSIHICKDDLRYFNIHGVLIHESVGHSSDVSVYPVPRFFDTLKIWKSHPLRILELRAIASVPMLWKKINERINVPYKPWNILHPVSGSLDCINVYEWFFYKNAPWKKADNVLALKKMLSLEDTESMPHLLARIYLLILATELDSFALWKYVKKSNIYELENRINHILQKRKTVKNSLEKGLMQKYREYLMATKVNSFDITKFLLKNTKAQKFTNFDIYNFHIGEKGIQWVDKKPIGLSWNDHFTWKFSQNDFFEDQGCDGPNFENVLGNKDCHEFEYVNIWKKCHKLGDLIMRYTENNTVKY